MGRLYVLPVCALQYYQLITEMGMVWGFLCKPLQSSLCKSGVGFLMFSTFIGENLDLN